MRESEEQQSKQGGSGIGQAQMSSEGWQKASSLVAAMTDLSALFTSCIRTIVTSREVRSEGGAGVLKGMSRDQVRILLNRSPTLQRIFADAAKAMKGESMDTLRESSTDVLLSTFSADEFCSIITLVYLMRRIRKRCNEEEWHRLLPQVLCGAEIGSLAGGVIPEIGAARGLLVGGLRPLSLGLFLARDLKGFQMYRRRVSAKRRAFDMEDEEFRWQTNNIQISAMLLQAMGYSHDTVTSFGMAFHKVPSPEHASAAKSWTRVIETTEALYISGAWPEIELPPGFSDKPELQTLREEAAAVFAEGTHFKWLSTTREDLAATEGGETEALDSAE